MSQKPNSDNPSADSVPRGDDVSSEVQKTAGKEARESADISNQNSLLKNAAKADGINDANKSIDQNIEGAAQGFSHPANTNPDALVQWVLKESYEQTNEDLKEYAGKVKPGNETDHPGGDRQMMTAQFEDANQKTSQFIHVIQNTLKKMGGMRRGIAGNMKDGNGKKNILGILLITGFVGLVVTAVVGIRNAQPSKEVSQEPKQPGNNPSVLVIAPTSATGCSISFTGPANAAELPNFGPVLFEWNDVPVAAAYSLKVAPPADASLPWIYPVSENTKNVYMENFPMGGTFLVSVNALSSDEKVLCTATLVFNKKELAVGDNKSNNNKGSNDSVVAPASTPCVNTGIAYFCP
jgi:hypothetical protein